MSTPLLQFDPKHYLQRHLCKLGLYNKGFLDLNEPFDASLYSQLQRIYPQDTYLHYELDDKKPRQIVVWYMAEWKTFYATVVATKAKEIEERKARLIVAACIQGIASAINLPLDIATKQALAEGFYKSRNDEKMQTVFKQYGIDILGIVGKIEKENE